MLRHSSLVSLMFMSGIAVRLFVQWAGMRKLATDTWPAAATTTRINITSNHADSMMMDLPLSLLLLSGNLTNKKAQETVQVVVQRHLAQKRPDAPVKIQVPVEPVPAVSSQQSVRTATSNETHDKSNLIAPSSKISTVLHVKKAQTKKDYHRRRAAAAYEWALARARARVKPKRNTTSSSSFLANNLGELYERETGQVLPSKRAVMEMRSFKLLNTIRIPKAASSALSVTARALAGCKPDGFPCCLDNVHGIDTCPIANLYCPYVRGCVGHLPEYEFMDSSLPIAESTITMVRHPVARGVSAFFYKPPHRPGNKCFTWQCFLRDYISNPVYSNPMTKMLVGKYAYDPDWFLNDNDNNNNNNSEGTNSNHTEMNMYENVIQQAKDRLCRMQWFGISEWPLASALLLYESHPFSKLLPNPVVFGLPPTNITSTSASTLNRRFEKKKANSTRNDADNTLSSSSSAEAAALRKNNNQAYQEFKKGVFVQGNGTQLLQRENAADMEIYDFALHVFCQRLQETGLLVLQAATSAKQVKLLLPSLNSQKNHDDWPYLQGCTNLLDKKSKNAQSHCPPRRLDPTNMATASSTELM